MVVGWDNYFTNIFLQYLSLLFTEFSALIITEQTVKANWKVVTVRLQTDSLSHSQGYWVLGMTIPKIWWNLVVVVFWLVGRDENFSTPFLSRRQEMYNGYKYIYIKKKNSWRKFKFEDITSVQFIQLPVERAWHQLPLHCLKYMYAQDIKTSLHLFSHLYLYTPSFFPIPFLLFYKFLEDIVICFTLEAPKIWQILHWS